MLRYEQQILPRVPPQNSFTVKLQVGLSNTDSNVTGTTDLLFENNHLKCDAIPKYCQVISVPTIGYCNILSQGNLSYRIN